MLAMFRPTNYRQNRMGIETGRLDKKRLALMTFSHPVTFPLLIAAVVSAIPAVASAASQQDYCIKCANPDETYICRIVSDNSRNTQGKQFLCIVNIARERGHDSCMASSQPQGCSGVLVRYEVPRSERTPGTGAGMIPRPPLASAPAPVPAPVTRVTPPADKEPETLVEFTRQATKATQKGLKSAGSGTTKAIRNTGKALSDTGSKITNFTSKVGSNIKKATQSTLKCLTSLFSNCK